MKRECPAFPAHFVCLPVEVSRSVFGPGKPRYRDTARIEGCGGSMIRHAPEAAAFPVGPLPVAVIEPSFPTLLVPPVGDQPLLPPRFPPAALAAVLVPPVTMTTDPEHHATAGPPAKPPPQGLFAGPHPRPSGGTRQTRLGMAISTPSADALFTLRCAERAPLLSGEHGRIRHGAQTRRLGSHRGSHL